MLGTRSLGVSAETEFASSFGEIGRFVAGGGSVTCGERAVDPGIGESQAMVEIMGKLQGLLEAISESTDRRLYGRLRGDCPGDTCG